MNWGWRGIFRRALEFASSVTSAVAPASRGRLRYNGVIRDFQKSVDGSAWELLSPSGGSQTATEQATWYINAITGDDTNDGATSATALKTLNEYLDRIGSAVVKQASVVNIETDIAEPVLTFRGYYEQGLSVIGATTVLGTGTFTGVQAYDATVSPGVDGQVTDASIPVSWTASGYVGKLIRLTSGPNAGAAGWIIKDLGSKTARFSPFWNDPSYQNVDPQVGESYEVLDLTLIDGQVEVISEAPFTFAGGVEFQYLQFNNAVPWSASLNMNVDCIGLFCDLAGYYLVWQPGSNNALLACHIRPSAGMWGYGGIAYLQSCAVSTRIRLLRGGTEIGLYNQNVFQNTGPRSSVELQQGSSLEVDVFQSWVAFFDDTASNPAIEVGPAANARFRANVWGLNWGSGAGAKALVVKGAGTITFPGGNFSTYADIQTPGTEVTYGTLTSTYAGVGTGVIDPATNGQVVREA